MFIGIVLNAWLHIMAAVIWVGGAYFISRVMAPAAAVLAPPEAGKLNQAVSKVWVPTAWVSIALVVLTGLTRVIGLRLYVPDILFGTAYGNVLLLKLLLVAAMIFVAAVITQTGADIAKMAAGGPPPADRLRAAQGRIMKLAATNIMLGSVVILLSVALRVMGFPEI
jgi:uncharacterized membrane protein